MSRPLLKLSEWFCTDCSIEHDADNTIRFFSFKRTRVIEISRPKMMNTLTLEMVKAMSAKILSWHKSDDVQLIIIIGANDAKGNPVFCAGGDIVAIASAKENPERQTGFLQIEYAMNHLIAVCEKPIIAIMDGITMGSGAGISIHGMYRIATENTIFAMPETEIGFIPDVGSSYFLSRLGPLGTYLALTGARLHGADA